MKNKDEETIIPESPTISEMLGNEDDDERAESRGRSARGKRRTAREIANMFDQLKHRHMARKKEWQDEKNELIRKVQMAEESKRVLAELKIILENLREELKHEETKRLGMEASHIAEKLGWESEREDLMKNLEESDKEGAAITELTGKLADQARQLADWQTNVMDLKRKMLEQEQRYLKERKEMEDKLERERESWQKKEKILSEKIRMLDSKSTLSSSSAQSPGTSPSSTPFPSGMDFDIANEGRNNGSHQMTRRKSSTSSAHEATSTKYNTFQRTVDNALKQIEKISEDLKHIDESTSTNESPDPASKPLLQHSMPSIGFSPCPPSATPTLSQSSHDSDPTVNAPWRTRRRSNLLKHPKPENQADKNGASKSTDTNGAAHKSKSSPAPSVHPVIAKDKLSPTVNIAQLRISSESRSPNPQRRVKKIDRQGSQVDIVISSPESTNLPSAALSRDIRLHKSQVPYAEHSDTSSSPAFADKPRGFNGSTLEATPVRRKSQNINPSLESKVPALDSTHMSSMKVSPKPSAVVAPLKMEYEAKDRTQAARKEEKLGRIDQMLAVKRDTATGRSSPKLPKLHQQLLFKDFPLSGSALPKKGSDEIKARYDSSSNESRRNMSTDKSEEDLIKADTPYSDPNTGYVAKMGDFSRKVQPTSKTDSLTVGKSAFVHSSKPHVGSAMASLGAGLFDMGTSEITAVAPPPVVQPKPKVCIRKDADGYILFRPKVKEDKDTEISERVSPEKCSSHSLAGRVGNVGKAGRDWIKKKLNFKDKKDSEQESDEKIRATPLTGDSPDYGKRKSRIKLRERSSSLLRSFNGRSATSRGRDDRSTSEDSNASDGGVRRRESFLKRSKKKGKKVSVVGSDPKTSSPTKSRPKRYTRSKTDGSTLEMKNFLTKFKASQSNPKKPSVLKQFELKLLENEVKTLEEEERLRKQKETQGKDKDGSEDGKRTLGTSTKAQDEGYSGEDESDFDNVEKGDSTERLVLPTIRQVGNSQVREKRGPPVKAKPYYRRSMNDLNLIDDRNQEMESQRRSGTSTTFRMKKEEELPAINRQSIGVKEADEVCGRKGVSSLVDRFSAIQENKDSDHTKPMNREAGRYSFRVPSTTLNEEGFHNGALQRSHSMSSPSSTTPYWKKKRPVSLGVGFEEPEITNSTVSQQRPSEIGITTWRDVVMSKPPETPTDSTAPSPPSEYYFLKADWPRDTKDEVKPGRSRVLSEEMRKKAEILEKALVKGPRKPKMYRRADTQPISSVYTSSEGEEDASDTEKGFQEAFKPFFNDFEKTEMAQRAEIDSEDLEKNTDSLPNIIPPVTTKFSKPAKPGRLPSRWAR